MNKLRSTPLSFNPEKFLAADSKKKATSAASRRQISQRRVIALGAGFKEALFLRLEKERPELFCGGADFRKFVEGASAIEAFLRSAIAREGLKVNDDIFSALHFDFLHDLGLRSGARKAGGVNSGNQ